MGKTKVNYYQLNPIMKILQINADRSRGAHDIAFATAAELRIDIIVASEPNRAIIKNKKWLTDERGDVAIYCTNNSIKVHKAIKQAGFTVLDTENFCLYGCYISPNIPTIEYETYIDRLIHNIWTTNKDILLLGDFNSKACEWGSPFTDRRGEVLLEAIGRLNLVILNRGNTPTFERANGRSFIDISFATENLARRIKDWKILDNESGSPHRHICIQIADNTNKRKTFKGKPYFDTTIFKNTVTDETQTDQTYNVNKLMEVMTKAYQKAKYTQNGTGSSTMPYWWNEELSTKRRACIAARRRCTRRTGREDNTDRRAQLWEDYKRERKEFKKMISKSKKEHWRTLCDSLNTDIWGSGYQIVKKSLIQAGPPYALTSD